VKTLFLLALIAFAVVVFLKFKKGAGTDKSSHSEKIDDESDEESAVNIRDAVFFKKDLLSEIEQSLFHRLKEACPEQIVLAQVSMSALVGIKKNPSWNAQFNKINRKYVDFVLCRPDFSINAVIELDDKTHEQYERWKSDDVKNVAFMNAGIKLIRFKAKELPSVEQIKAAIDSVHQKSSKGKAFVVE